MIGEWPNWLPTLETFHMVLGNENRNSRSLPVLLLNKKTSLAQIRTLVSLLGRWNYQSCREHVNIVMVLILVE